MNGQPTPETPRLKKRASDTAGPDNGAAKRSKLRETTDHSRWRMRDDQGRHTWHYLEDDEAVKDWPQTYADKYYLGLPLVSNLPLRPSPTPQTTDHARAQGLPTLPKPKKPLDAVKNGLEFFEKLQLPSGQWGCEYGGPMFLLPGVVIAWYVTKTPIPWAYATEIKNYLFARAHPEDGGWGLHIEGESSVFGTVMNYTTLRLIGVEADHPKMIKARATLHKLGGVTHSPHWGKFWMSLLGVAHWDIVNPVPPELWLLPDWAPISPWRWWIHMRQVFLSMSYIWSKKWVCEETDVIRSLRQELFAEPWESIRWASHRNTIAPVDNYNPKSWVLNTINWLLVNVWNPYLRTDAIKTAAEAWASELIDMEDENTDFSDLAPVNAPMNTICCYIRDGPGSYTVRRHLERLEEAIWVKDEGLLVNGTNGVQCWDTSFAIQTITDAGLQSDERWKPMLLRALEFLDDQQLRDNCVHQTRSYRQQRKGGWAFSNKDQGYAVSDCISESLKSVMVLQKSPGYPQLLDDRRIFDAVDTLLTFQNKSGGCSSYEPPRGGEWLELLNAAEVFGRIMVEYDYPECTTAIITALCLFRKHWPDYRADDIEAFLRRAFAYIKAAQRPDGGWYGSWGICFTYAGMFALESLASNGETYEKSEYSRKGCDFLVSKQREDGGWSESYRVSTEPAASPTPGCHNLSGARLTVA